MSIQKPTVLIVDDSQEKRYLVARCLREAGFDILECDNGEDALRLAREQPSVIALDVHLPDIVGYEVSRRLRSDPVTAGIPIVQISASVTSPNNRAKGLECGADSFLTGPIEPEELVATMKAMIRMRQAETMAKNLAAQWQATFDAISDAVCLVNAAGTIERCNGAFEALNRKNTTEMLGQDLALVCAEASLDPFVYSRMLGSRGRETVEQRLDHDWFSVSADPVLDVDGNFKGGVLIISNITDRKRVEQAREHEQAVLLEEAERLEAKVQERTLQLQASVKSMESFCYTIAHDLRAPLRAMSGFTSALLEGYASHFDEAGRELAKRVVNAARRMDQLIQALLAFGRLSHSDLPRSRVDLDSVMKTVLNSFTSEISEIGAVVEIHYPLPSVWCNQTILEQIVANLLGNALKFVGANQPPRIRIRAEEGPELIRLWVEDDGIGIEPAYHEKIFGLFERLHTDRQYHGTGLGLAIVRRGVERMGGHAGVESVPGQGSRFWIELLPVNSHEHN